MPKLEQRALLESYQEACARKVFLDPLEPTTPEGIYQAVLLATGDHELAQDTRAKVLLYRKIQSIMR